MAALNQEPWQTQRPQAHEIISQGRLAAPQSLDNNSHDSVNSGSLAFSDYSDHVATVGRTAKRQPWQAVWPAPREPVSQANIFGFKKGEVMVFDGNAGNFFARDAWVIEQEADNSSKEEANTAPLAKA